MIFKQIKKLKEFTVIIPDDEYYVLLDNQIGKWKIIEEKYEDSHDEWIESLDINRKEHEKVPANNSSEIIIFLTDKCNLACSYCKYANLTQINQYPEVPTSKIIETACSLIKDQNYITITFQGGEPLLCYKQINLICESLITTYPSTSFNFGLQTNGTLINDQIIKVLTKYNISVGITIDGPRDKHDKNRSFKSGKGSYDQIITNLAAYRNIGISCGSLSVIDDPDGLRDIYNFCVKELGFKSIYLKPLEFTETLNPNYETIKNYYEKMAVNQIKLFQQILSEFKFEKSRISEQSLLTNLGKLFMPNSYNDGCIKTPYCGSNEAYKSINVDGNAQWCAHLKSISDRKFKIKAKKRNDFCKNCLINSICLSFCYALLPGVQISDNEESIAKHAQIMCDYRQSILSGLFTIIKNDIQNSLNYFFGYQAHIRYDD